MVARADFEHSDGAEGDVRRDAGFFLPLAQRRYDNQGFSESTWLSDHNVDWTSSAAS